MSKAITLVPKVAIFLAGVAAGALTLSRGKDKGAGAQANAELKKALAEMEGRLAAQESSAGNRFAQLETRLDEHASKLAEVPTTSQIVNAMEQLLSKTMASLDDRLTSQAHSIEVLKTTVSQTDSLLERVLESLDSLQTFTDPSELAQDALLQQRPV
jgi:chromosome segregation ATPase